MKLKLFLTNSLCGLPEKTINIPSVARVSSHSTCYGSTHSETSLSYRTLYLLRHSIASGSRRMRSRSNPSYCSSGASGADTT